jgi:diguanylate cyclase (GGDEF)-like protein
MNEEGSKIENFVSVGVDITAKKKLEELASIDKLTRIYNRRMLDEFLQIKIEEAKRYKEELSLIIIDIDHFKVVNDTYGHLVGDNTLTQTSEIISSHLRTSNIFGRYGGEKFLIICSKTSKENAFILAEKLRKEIKKFEFEKVGHKTISLGISNFEENDTTQSLFKKFINIELIPYKKLYLQKLISNNF